MRDQRYWAGYAPRGAVYYFSPDRRGEHPHKHLKNSMGILQADIHTGFKALYHTRAYDFAQYREAVCWAHLWRNFHDIWSATKSGSVNKALDRIGQLYDFGRDIKSLPADERYSVRQQQSKP